MFYGEGGKELMGGKRCDVPDTVAVGNRDVDTYFNMSQPRVSRHSVRLSPGCIWGLGINDISNTTTRDTERVGKVFGDDQMPYALSLGGRIRCCDKPIACRRLSECAAYTGCSRVLIRTTGLVMAGKISMTSGA